MHDEIIRFGLSGQMEDSNIVKERERLIAFLENRMRDEGCVPNLDLEPQFTLDYNQQSETYEFDLTVYGVYVGGEAWDSSGVTIGKMITKYTPQPR